jgi:hypothetical protein
MKGDESERSAKGTTTHEIKWNEREELVLKT